MSIIWDKSYFWQVALNERIHCPFFFLRLIRNKTGYSKMFSDIDSNLTFNGHIASLTSSLLSTLVQINRVWHFFSKDVLYMILNSRLVFSKLFYCFTVWSGTSKEHIPKLQLMLNFAGRILTNTKKFDHITPVLHKLVLLTIDELLR